MSYQKVASQLTIPELKQLGLFSSDMQEMFVLLLCNDLSSLFYFLSSFFLSERKLWPVFERSTA